MSDDARNIARAELPEPEERPAADTQPQVQAPREESYNSDALFSMYLNKVLDEDKEMVDSWKDDANGMLTFVRLPIVSHTPAYNV